MTPFYRDDLGQLTLYHADVLDGLRALPSGSVHCIVTSPPYLGLRTYQVEGQLGLESTPEEFVANLVAVFRECRRVLRDDGVLWVNLGSSYMGSGGAHKPGGANPGLSQSSTRGGVPLSGIAPGLKPLDNMMMPARVARALQADGWYLRSAITWVKPAPMPESVSGVRWEKHRVKVKAQVDYQGSHYTAETGLRGHGADIVNRSKGIGSTEWADCPGCKVCEPNGGLVLRKGSWRPTHSSEMIYMLTKSADYWADGEDVREDSSPNTHRRAAIGGVPSDRFKMEKAGKGNRNNPSFQAAMRDLPLAAGRNLRDVWIIGPEPFSMTLCKNCKTVYEPQSYRRLMNGSNPQCNTEIDEDVQCGGTDFDYGDGVFLCRNCLTARSKSEMARLPKAKRCRVCKESVWVGHFASFPTALPKKCILAATSERGVCPKCGAQWARIVEVRDVVHQREPAHQPGNTPTKVDSTGWEPTTGNTIGWRPTCRCPGLDGDAPWPDLAMHPDGEANWPTVPATVLDIFMGSGSTAVAARELGRIAWGIDLQEDYLRMAVERNQQGSLL